MKLRPYQETIVHDVRSAMRAGKRSILVCAPTGSGKTALTAHMLASAASKEMSSWFIVHRRELIKQSIRAFDVIRLKHGVIASGFIEEPDPFTQIASIGTLANRFERARKPKLIVWDECHHVAAGSWTKIFKAFPDAFHIGLTATPERLDGRGLGDFFKTMVLGPSVKWLIENKYLSKFVAFDHGTANLSNVRSSMGDFVKSELAAAIDQPTITGSAIREYKSKCNGARAVGFAVSIEHSKHVVAQFNANGVPAKHVDGETPSDERDHAIQQFQRGDILFLCNVGLFGEGFDLPAIECGIDLAPTRSLGKYLQGFGRILRTHPGKSKAIWLDHAGNIERHGLPDEIREWSLLGRDKKRAAEKKESIKVCSECFAAQIPGKTHCVYCGHEFEKKPREVAEVAGDLVEVDPSALAARRAKNKEQGSAQTIDDLIAVGRRRGYKRPEMWAKHVFNGRQARKIGR